jgi:hypothetical protein
MGDIYANAHRTLVWLGHASEDSDLAMDFIPKINEAFKIIKDSPEVTEELLLKTLQVERASSTWEALGNLLSRPWFQRLWVIQEVALSATVYAVCGGRSLEWAIIGDMIENLYRRRLAHLIRYKPATKMLTQGGATLLGMQTIKKRQEDGTKGKLSAVLFEAMGFQATNAEDQIFGVFGLVRGSRGLDVGYRDTVQDIYTKATLWSINEEQQYDILYLSGITHTRHVPNLPSWVPDFSLDILLNPFGIPAPGQAIHYQAGGVIAPGTSVRVDATDKCIVLQGSILDSIQDFGQVRIASHQEALDVTHKPWREWILQALELGMAYREKAHTPHVPEDVWRTLIANTTHPTKDPAGPEYQNYFQAFQCLYLDDASEKDLDWRHVHDKLDRDPSIGREMKTHASCYLFAFLDATIGRRFCVTENGRVGLVPSGVAKGDKICIIRGARVPFVIREVVGTIRDGETVFVLVGDCYVDGLMTGDAPSTVSRFHDIRLQ